MDCKTLWTYSSADVSQFPVSGNIVATQKFIDGIRDANIEDNLPNLR